MLVCWAGLAKHVGCGLLQVTQEKCIHNTINYKRASIEVLNLKAELGTGLSLLRRLRANAQAYSDFNYYQYSHHLEQLFDTVMDFCDLHRKQYMPHINAVQSINIECAQALAARRASAHQILIRRDAAIASLLPVDLLSQRDLGDVQSIEWRYPPKDYVLFQPKGAKGGWVAPLGLPGLDPPVPHVRQKELLPEQPSRQLQAVAGLFD